MGGNVSNSQGSKGNWILYDGQLDKDTCFLSPPLGPKNEGLHLTLQWKCRTKKQARTKSPETVAAQAAISREGLFVMNLSSGGEKWSLRGQWWPLCLDSVWPLLNKLLNVAPNWYSNRRLLGGFWGDEAHSLVPEDAIPGLGFQTPKMFMEGGKQSQTGSPGIVERELSSHSLATLLQILYSELQNQKMKKVPPSWCLVFWERQKYIFSHKITW